MVIQKMQPSYNKVLPIEKIISILSYLSMGIIGVIWLIIELAFLAPKTQKTAVEENKSDAEVVENK